MYSCTFRGVKTGQINSTWSTRNICKTPVLRINDSFVCFNESTSPLKVLVTRKPPTSGNILFTSLHHTIRFVRLFVLPTHVDVMATLSVWISLFRVGIHRWPIDSSRKGSLIGTFVFMLAWTSCWTRWFVADDLERQDAHLIMISSPASAASLSYSLITHDAPVRVRGFLSRFTNEKTFCWCLYFNTLLLHQKQLYKGVNGI